MADEYTPQQITVTVRAENAWQALAERAHDQWRTLEQQLNAEVERMLTPAKPRGESASTATPRAVQQRRGPRAQAA